MEHSSQSNRTYLQQLIALALSLWLFAGCDETNTNTLHITVLDESVLANTEVCIDSNENLQCDENEVSNKTDAKGSTTLHVRNLEAPYNVLALTNFTNNRKDANATYAMEYSTHSANEPIYVSPFSTLAKYAEQETLETLLEVEPKILARHYVNENDDYAIILAQLIRDTQLYLHKYHNSTQPDTHIQSSALKVLISKAAELIEHAKALAPSNTMRSLTRNSTTDATIPWDNTLELGRGYDTLAEYPISGSKCVTLDINSTQDSLCSNQTQYNFELIESEQDLLNKFRVGARASLDVIVASAHGAVDFTKTVMEKRNKLYVLIQHESALCSYMYDANDFSINSQDKTLYTQNYNNFRTSCGDGFLGMVQSGGQFIGLFQLDYENEAHKKELTVSLKAKVLGITVYHHTFRDRVNSLFNEFSARYTIDATTGDRRSNYNANIDEFYAAYDDFVNHLNGDACTQENGYDQCKYLATFYDYGLVESDMFAQTSQAEQILAGYNQLALDYDELERDLDFYATRPLLFPSVTSDTISTVRGEISLAKSIIKQYAQTCENSPANCVPYTQINNLSSAESIKTAHALPDPNFAPYLTCKELKTDNPSLTEDGTFTLYAERDLTKPFSATCKAMSSDTPTTHLALIHHQLFQEEPITFFRYNYGIAMPLSSSGDTQYTMVRYFDTIEIEPCSESGECFTVVGADGFTQITPDGYSGEVPSLEYGSALYQSDATPPTHPLLNMDLTDTSFRFDTLSGVDGTTLIQSTDKKVVNVTFGLKASVSFTELKVYYQE